MAVGIGPSSLVPMVAAAGSLALSEIHIHTLAQSEVVGACFAVGDLLHLHGIDMRHVGDTLYREGDASVLIRENRVGDRDVVIVAVVAVGTAARARHLMILVPFVQTAETVVADTHLVVGAAAERMKAVAFLLVKTMKGKEIIVLKVLDEKIILGGCLHSQVAEQRCVGGIEAAGAHAVGHKAHIHHNVAVGGDIVGGDQLHLGAWINIIVAGTLHIVPVMAVGVRPFCDMAAPLFHIAEVDVEGTAHSLGHSSLRHAEDGSKSHKADMLHCNISFNEFNCHRMSILRPCDT